MKLAAIILALALTGCATTPIPRPHSVVGQIILVSPWRLDHVAGCVRCQILEVGQ